ncbi:hypothetical protein HanIR_Chr08g0387211 [Helianthus annuus]|nr:hypothetical protein HanIR_Chr08g0387211 [Helianthus annuus]
MDPYNPNNPNPNPNANPIPNPNPNVFSEPDYHPTMDLRWSSSQFSLNAFSVSNKPPMLLSNEPNPIHATNAIVATNDDAKPVQLIISIATTTFANTGRIVSPTTTRRR